MKDKTVQRIKSSKKSMEKHTHQEFQIITKYYKDAPADIISVYCVDCKEENPVLQGLLQEREREIFKLYGNKPPVIWLDKDQNRYMKNYMNNEELKNKRLC